MALKFLNGIDSSSQRIINVADGTSLTDAVTLQQLNNAIAGLNWKQNVKAASTSNWVIASALVNAATMDGVTLATNDRVLLKNQTTASENGIYVVAASGAASRATDANTSANVVNMAVRAAQGTVNADTLWQMVTDGITLGTTSLVYTPFTSGQTYTGGNGITVSGTSIAANPLSAGGITVASGGIGVDHTKIPYLYSTNVGDGTSTSITVNHALGTRDVMVQVYLNSGTYETVETDVQRTDANNVALIFATAPASAAYRCVVHG